MRRPPRILWNAGTFASALLCVTACALWARSHRIADFWMLAGNAHRQGSIRSMCGEIGYLRQDSPAAPPTQTVRKRHFSEEAGGPMTRGFADQGSILNRAGFAFSGRAGVGPPAATVTPSFLVVPYWFVAVSFGVVPCVRAGLAFRKACRSCQGRCRACGYDLRATPRRCPECGTLPAR